MSAWLSRITLAWDRWLFTSHSPAIVPWLRIYFGLMLLIYTVVWWLHADRWFTDEGLLTARTAQELALHRNWSLLYVLPATSTVVQACLATMLLQCMLLCVGVWSRFNMACIFVWLVSFQNRNLLIVDGEDTLFRLFAFMMIWLPLDCGWSLTRWWSAKQGVSLAEAEPHQAWALRLMQVQMTLIYVSATVNKLAGQTWREGTAMYFVSFMTDHFGRIPSSQYWFDNWWVVHLTTWGALLIEGVLPIGLWLPRWRRWAVALGILLHLAIELTMHLFLFEWIMILGLLTFLGSGPTARVSATVPAKPTGVYRPDA